MLSLDLSINTMQLKSTKADIDAKVSEVRDFDTLFNTHWDKVYGVVYRIVGDPSEAEDLALESFLKLHQRPPRRKTNLSGWLYRVATNLAFNALRSRKRRTAYETAAGKHILETKSPINPGEAVERTEACRRVREVLSKMKGRSARILILRHSGLSYAEIARAVGVADSSVGTLLSRAEKEFERRYKRSFEMDKW